MKEGCAPKGQAAPAAGRSRGRHEPRRAPPGPLRLGSGERV